MVKLCELHICVCVCLPAGQVRPMLGKLVTHPDFVHSVTVKLYTL